MRWSRPHATNCGPEWMLARVTHLLRGARVADLAAIDPQGSAFTQYAFLDRWTRTTSEVPECPLWLAGHMIGPDRANKVSPYQFGSDAVVGLATIAQLAGQLCRGMTALLEIGSLYSAAALLRQIVETEYIAWAFAEDEDEAANWMRSSRDERLDCWQPRHLRGRSAGRFRAEDYHRHCEIGGHPTPASLQLLPDHKAYESTSYGWTSPITESVSGDTSRRPQPIWALRKWLETSLRACSCR
jgi:hypothetical protein